MNNATTAGPQGPLPDLKTLIKPEHIRAWSGPGFPPESKEKYITGVTGLWHKIENLNPESEEYQNAHRKLYEVTVNIKRTMQNVRTQFVQSAQQAAGAVPQNGNRPTSSGPPSQQHDVRQGPQHTQLNGQPMGGQPQGVQTFSPKVLEHVKSITFIPPPSTNGNENAQKQWIRNAQNKYAQNLQKLEEMPVRLSQLHQAAATRNQHGKPLDEKETENYRSQVTRLEQMIKDSQQIITNFNAQQDILRKEQMKGQTGNGASAAPTSQPPNAGVPNGMGVGGQPQVKAEPQSQPHTVSSAVDAARNQANAAARSAMSPPQNGQPSQSQPPNSRPPLNQTPVSHSHPPSIVNNGSRSQDPQVNSPRAAQSQTSAMPHEPVPLSHSAAVDAARDAARSYSQPNVLQQTPQSTSQGPSSDQRSQNNHAKMPIPKDLHLPPTIPVSVGTSRPTLTNGPMAMGPMGQPALQRHPGYVLEGEGERVLSKKKLEELVRQVTGGAGGEGEEGEGLTADVEETLLQVADDFVDQVIVAACRLAKLRQSSSLELRDLQLILERNYNIRVPGYASDELRTVKKVIPSQVWTQKLSAVQAAKVTGGKNDL